MGRGGGSRCKGPAAGGVSWAWSEQRKAAVWLITGEQKEERHRAPEAMGRTLAAILSIN